MGKLPIQFWVLFLFSLIQVNLTIYAKNGEVESDSSKHFYLFEMQYQIDDNFQLKNFRENFFALKWNLNQMNSIRLLLNYSSDVQEVKESPRTSGSPVLEIDEKRSYDFRTTLIYMFHFIRREKFQTYLGIGPNFAFKFDEFLINQKSINEADFSEVEYRQTSSYGLGASFLVGVDWLLLNRLSLLLESEFEIQNSDFELTDKRFGSVNTKRLISNLWPARFGISVRL